MKSALLCKKCIVDFDPGCNLSRFQMSKTSIIMKELFCFANLSQKAILSTFLLDRTFALLDSSLIFLKMYPINVPKREFSHYYVVVNRCFLDYSILRCLFFFLVHIFLIILSHLSLFISFSYYSDYLFLSIIAIGPFFLIQILLLFQYI